MVPEKLALRNAFLIDGTGNEPMDCATVIVEGRTIREVGGSRLPTPKGFHEVDVGGRTLLPGIIDLHVHTHSVYTEPDAMQYDLPRTAMLAARRAELALFNGITTMRDAGAQKGVAAALKRETEKGVIVGSRIVPCGDIIAVTGGHGWKRSGTEADGPYGMRREVRHQLKMGADHIKLAVTHRGPICEPTPEELNAAVDEAHRYGIPVACHAGIEPGIECAVRAGVDSIEHGWLASDTSIKEMAERGTYWVPTISVLRGMIDEGQTWEDRETRQYDLKPLLGQDERRFRMALEYSRQAWHNFDDIFRRMRAAGVTLAVGTDAPLGGLPIYAAINEVRWLVELGLKPMEAIQAATQIAARVVALDDVLGTVEAGKWADLLVVDGNPLDDITTLQNTYAVAKDGRFVRWNNTNLGLGVEWSV